MQYIKINTDQTTIYPYDSYQIRKDFPNTSFPEQLELIDLSPYGVFPVTRVPKPTYNSTTHVLSEGTPTLVNSVWTQNWVLTALSTEDAAAELTKARKARWREIKDIRDDKIKNGGVLLVDKWYSTSTDSKVLILWVIAMGSAVPTTQRIEQMDGSMANLSYNRANDLLAAASAQSAAITDYADSLKVLVDAAADPYSVDITTGWPATYA